MLGGALSNLLDGIRMGRVVDILDFYFRSYHCSTFTLADSAIAVGACRSRLSRTVCGSSYSNF